LAPIIEPYFGQEESLYQESSSIPGLLASAVPMLFTATEFDGPFLHRQVWQILNGRFQRDGQIQPLLNGRLAQGSSNETLENLDPAKP